ncbi:FAD-binding oxidoreductase [Candidatus Thiosymbion oneisti]|uniref:FAD-binding oxidoreductase n=1 Tax=Candidatus Thiosymbion oneisti TaxID=589554 RepID=UPI000B8028D0|nr:FAD-binding oxidoreductase [Candidatus Thiosymbion oneisti]
MAAKRYQSWGRYPKADQATCKLYWRDAPLPMDRIGERTCLPFGNGRSYGDVCLNDGGILLDCRQLDRCIRFDTDTGVLRCEAGVLLADILRLTVPKGWLLPVTPGTRFVTVGGAVANDVHGKNHHQAGTLGRHIRRFELLRSDGERLICAPDDNPDFYQATIAGLGLTGVITWAELQLKGIRNPYLEREIIRYGNLDEFFALARESNRDYTYTAAWIDCSATGTQLGRGLFIRGNHAESITGKPPRPPTRQLRFPIDPPFSLINGLTLKLFNRLYYHRQPSDRMRDVVHYEPFFYPLDTILDWNRVYGSKGFLQYQCALPSDRMEDAIREILERIAKAGIGSFLAVLKLFGDQPSPGLLSFPMPGATLALDFPNHGEKTLRLLDQLDAVTRAVGGRLNPAKDARMRPEDFQNAYPHWKTMETYLDPRISSGFWRRVTVQS